MANGMKDESRGQGEERRRSREDSRKEREGNRREREGRMTTGRKVEEMEDLMTEGKKGSQRRRKEGLTGGYGNRRKEGN